MNNNGTALWPQDRTDRLKTLWAEGHSASVVAVILGVNRGAIAGKVQRLGLPKRRTAICKRNELKPRTRKAKALHAIFSKPVLIVDHAIDLPSDQSEFACTLMKLTEVSCRWPLGDPKSQDFQFCGAQKVEGLSYCPRHAVLAYRRS